MSTVFLIGNGFDLNLGLKTSYKDFVNSEFFKYHLGDGFLFDHLAKVNQESNWIDIEDELQTFSRDTGNNPDFKNQYKKLCEALKSYISSIDINAINENSEAYQLLKNEAKDDFQIINFNYTDCAYHILKKLGHGDDIRQKILHIHGSIHIDNIIFGVDDSAAINPEHVFLNKSRSSFYNSRQCVQALNNFKSLHIFGHSLGESDKTYFNFLHRLCSKGIRADGEKSIKIYHYDENSADAIYQRLQILTHRKVALLKTNISFKEINLVADIK